MKIEIEVSLLLEKKQTWFNSEPTLVDFLGRRLGGMVDSIWIKDIEFLVEFIKLSRKLDEGHRFGIKFIFDKKESEHLEHYFVKFPRLKTSDSQHDELTEIISALPLVDLGGFAPVRLIDDPLGNVRIIDPMGNEPDKVISKIELKNSVKVNPYHIYRLVDCASEIATTKSVFDWLKKHRTAFETCPKIGEDKGGGTIILLRHAELSPPVIMDDSIREYSLEGIPAFDGMDVKGFGRMRDPLGLMGSPYWIIEKSLIERMKAAGGRLSAYPVLDIKSKLYEDFLQQWTLIVEMLREHPDSTIAPIIR